MNTLESTKGLFISGNKAVQITRYSTSQWTFTSMSKSFVLVYQHFNFFWRSSEVSSLHLHSLHLFMSI